MLNQKSIESCFIKKDYSNLKITQWFLDPLNKKGPDFNKNKDGFIS